MSWRRSGDLADRGRGRRGDEGEAAAAGEDEAIPGVRGARGEAPHARAVADRVTVTGVGPREAGADRETLGRTSASRSTGSAVADILEVTGTDRYEFLTYRLNETPEGRSCACTCGRSSTARRSCSSARS